MIELSKISRTFSVGGQPVHALVDIDERIESGEHLAIMGPSGSGKSTLLNILGCLDRPSSGSYQFDGREVALLSEEERTHLRRHRIGFVFQFFHLVPRLSALENAELPMIFAGLPAEERKRKALAALSAVGLADRAQHRPDQLSGGEQQRAALARATVMGPSLLLADEPTGNLDSASGRQVLDHLERMNREGLTLMVVTHDLSVARRADRIIMLADGRISRRLAGEEVSQVARFLDLSPPAP